MNENVSDLPYTVESQNSWYNWHLYRYEIKYKHHKICTSPIAVNQFVCELDRVISQCFWKKMDAIFGRVIVRMTKNRNGFITNFEFLILGKWQKVCRSLWSFREIFHKYENRLFSYEKGTISDVFWYDYYRWSSKNRITSLLLTMLIKDWDHSLHSSRPDRNRCLPCL